MSTTRAPMCAVLGGGGHAKVVIEVLLREGKYRPVGVTDLRGGGWDVQGIPVLGDESLIPELPRSGIHWFVVGVGGVPDNRPRSRLFLKACAVGLKPLIAVHPSAVVARTAHLGPGTVVMPAAVLNPDSRLGPNVIINTAAVIEHDVRIGDHAHICPGAVLSGGVTIGEGAFIGAAAVIRQGIRVGDWAVVGAGAVVIRDVPSGAWVAGVPAHPLRRRATAAVLPHVHSR